MLDFKPISLDDRNDIEKYFFKAFQMQKNKYWI